MKVFMKMVLVLAGCVSLDPVLAQPPRAASEGSSVVDTIKQIERDWANAIIVGDKDKLSRAIADDFVELSGGGQVETKASFMTHTISGNKKLTAVEWGPEDVTMLGNVVVVQASATETWDTDGQASITQIAYMDIYVKREATGCSSARKPVRSERTARNGETGGWSSERIRTGRSSRSRRRPAPARPLPQTQKNR
jgi:hypothetical protein